MKSDSISNSIGKENDSNKKYKNYFPNSNTSIKYKIIFFKTK